MNLQLTRLYAILISALAIAGLFVSGHLFAIMNTDTTLDLVRILLAVYLIYVGFVSKAERSVHTALLVVGALYIGMGLLALGSPTLGGILPSGLTGFDVAFHLITGAAATIAGISKESHGRAAHSH